MSDIGYAHSQLLILIRYTLQSVNSGIPDELKKVIDFGQRAYSVLSTEVYLPSLRGI